MYIGLLEDDTNQIELIGLWASEAGYRMQSYTSGDSFRDAVDTEDFDLLILDWNLPDTTGLVELDWLRAGKASHVPVIFITSRDSEANVVEALDHGADDYMVKPVNKQITLSRLKALQRRTLINNSVNSATNGVDVAKVIEESNIEVFKPYTIDHKEKTISVNGEPVKLTNKEFELIVYLFGHAGCLVTRDVILEKIWGKRADLNTRTVDTHVSRIRSKLGINPTVGWQLTSIYQRGYRLVQVPKES